MQPTGLDWMHFDGPFAVRCWLMLDGDARLNVTRSLLGSRNERPEDASRSTLSATLRETCLLRGVITIRGSEERQRAGGTVTLQTNIKEIPEMSH